MSEVMVQQVRRFNRIVTERVGALNDRFLGRDRPLGEARLLWEIGSGGGELRQLRASLGLDSGYVSRLLRSLEDDGLIEVSQAEGDRRVRRVRWLRRAGLATLLDLPGQDVPTFFEAFFRLPPDLQRAYLTSRDQPAAVSAAMARMALSLSPRMITRALTPTLRTAVWSLVGRPGR